MAPVGSGGERSSWSRPCKLGPITGDAPAGRTGGDAGWSAAAAARAFNRSYLAGSPTRYPWVSLYRTKARDASTRASEPLVAPAAPPGPQKVSTSATVAASVAILLTGPLLDVVWLKRNDPPSRGGPNVRFSGPPLV